MPIDFNLGERLLQRAQDSCLPGNFAIESSIVFNSCPARAQSSHRGKTFRLLPADQLPLNRFIDCTYGIQRCIEYRYGVILKIRVFDSSVFWIDSY